MCKEIASASLRVTRIGDYTDDKFTTGDAVLDELLGGGIRTGMLWELVGERFVHKVGDLYFCSDRVNTV